MEMFVIVASVLLALTVNEWWESREDRQRAREAREQFRAEILRNRAEVEDALRYHRSVRERLGSLVEELGSGAPYDVDERGSPLPRGFRPPVLRETAWRTAMATRALQELEYVTVTRISDAYTMQRLLTEQFDRILRGFMRPESFATDRPLELFRFLLVSLTDVVAMEAETMSAYGRALEALGAASPGEASGARADSGSAGGTAGGADSRGAGKAKELVSGATEETPSGRDHR